MVRRGGRSGEEDLGCGESHFVARVLADRSTADLRTSIQLSTAPGD
jgi:hypothetical protein